MIVRDEDKKFISQVYYYSFVGLMLDWIKNDMKDNSEELVGRFALVIQDSISGALERFRVDKNTSKETE